MAVARVRSSAAPSAAFADSTTLTAAPEVAGLVARARTGDEEAWVLLYRQVHPGLYAFARRRLWTHDDAVDAVNETMARAVASLASFRDLDGAFAGWLFGILRNVVMNLQRAAARPVPTEAEVATPDALEPLLAGEDADELRAAFAQLTPADRELLELRVVAGLSADEVATALGRSPGAVRMAQSRALARLRELLEVTR
jgi:RNA polymerase sigma-70 factor (ECF subfamily)